jgi:hypothetical protein
MLAAIKRSFHVIESRASGRSEMVGEAYPHMIALVLLSRYATRGFNG